MKSIPTPDALKRVYAPMTPEFAARTRAMLQSLRDEKEAEKTMKRKVFVCIALAVLLALTSVTALALTVWRDDIAKILQMEHDSGYYDDWPLADKLRLLSLMEKNGVSMDASRLAIAQDETQPDTAREQAADAIVGETYGIDGRLDTVTAVGIMETELGADFYHWPIEDMAWFSEMEFRAKGGSQDAEIFTLPKEGDLTQAEALAKAKAVLKDMRGIDADEAAFVDFTVQYVCYPFMAEPMNEPEWRFSWVTADGAEEYVSLSPTGEINDVWHTDFVSRDARWDETLSSRQADLEARVGPMADWSLADWAAYDPGRYHEPTADDIAPDKAIAIAKQALLSDHGFTADALSSMKPSLRLYLDHVDPDGAFHSVYSVTFTSDTSTVYISIRSDTGEVVE